MSKSRLPSVFEGGERGVLVRRSRPVIDSRRRRQIPCGGRPRPTATSPRRASPGGVEERALARNAALGIGDRAALLAPAERRQQHMGVARRVGRLEDIARRRRRGSALIAAFERHRHRASRPTGLVAMIQSALMRPSADGLEHVDGLQARLLGDRRRLPEALHAIAILGDSRSPYGRQACWPARQPHGRPWRSAGPVSENGPMPGRPMRPVARWQLRMALTLSVPDEDWLTPWL